MTDNGSQSEDSAPDGESQPSLTSRVVKSAGWVFAGKVAGRGMSVIKMVVLARLLGPEDFGLFGIVMLALATMKTFTKTGFNKALIQQKSETESYLDTAWTVQLIRGAVLAAALFIAAPAVGWFFEEPRAVPVLRVLSVMELLRGGRNIGVIYFQKELEFHKQVLYEVTGSFIGLVVGVVLAYQLRSVWALAWASLARRFSNMILSYILHPYKPHLAMDWGQARQLFGFGKWMLGISVMSFLATQGDDAFLGKVLGASALGIYQMSYRMGNAVRTEISDVANRVLLPAYAKVQDDKAKLGRGFLQAFEMVVSVTLPLAAFIAAVSPEIVLGILGEQWESAVLPLRILAIYGFIRAVVAFGGPLFVGSGHPHLSFWMNVVRVGVGAVLIYPLTIYLGVPGTALSVLTGLVASIAVWAKVKHIAGINWLQLIYRMLPGVTVAGAGICAAYLGRFATGTSGTVETLIYQSVLATVLGGAMIWMHARLFENGLGIQMQTAWRALREVQ